MPGLLRSLVVVGGGAALALGLLTLLVWQPDPLTAEPAIRPSAPALRAQAIQPGACDLATTTEGRALIDRGSGSEAPAGTCSSLSGPTPVVPEIGLPVLLPLSAALTALVVVLVQRARPQSAQRRQGS